jgi:LuxR family transcriptional regulator, maltose regulon positive regulatory protein
MMSDGSRQTQAYRFASAVQRGIVPRHRLFERLDSAARVTQISAPAGSGKTFLVRSWLSESGLADNAAWVPVRGGEHDTHQFWISLVEALRDTIIGAKLVRPLTSAPDLDGWLVAERLLEDLGTLEDPLWLVIDDAHELRPAEASAQLELLVKRAPADLRILVITRKDVRLGLHRLRPEGELTELRAADLRFTLDEARALLGEESVELPEAVLAALVQRTEGWAVGLRLAALSLARHPDPVRFAKEFSGSERTVAEYLLAEVLDQQSEPVRRLLLRTSVCERVTGELADLLADGLGGEKILQDLEEAGAFVVALDARRSWFRYHSLFADLLQLQLRRTDPAGLADLHGTAAGWFAAHGYPVEAGRHAQAAQDWNLAVRLLSDHFLALFLGGQCAIWQLRLDDAEALLEQADRARRGEAAPAVRVALHQARGTLQLARGDNAKAQVGETLLRASRRRPAKIVCPRPALCEPLTESETRVLRYLPTNLPAPEIASELTLSVNTVRTHMRHLYEKLATHSRSGAVERARALGLLAPATHWP